MGILDQGVLGHEVGEQSYADIYICARVIYARVRFVVYIIGIFLQFPPFQVT
jgi:hypothetical protein